MNYQIIYTPICLYIKLDIGFFSFLIYILFRLKKVYFNKSNYIKPVLVFSFNKYILIYLYILAIIRLMVLQYTSNIFNILTSLMVKQIMS